MAKILILAYAISPYRGSEYSVAWNYITEMSKDNELVVLYGVSGDHMGDFREMNDYLSNNKVANVRFLPVPPNRYTSLLNILNKKGIFVYSFYFAYHNWHKQVYKVVNQLIKKESFDLIHFLNPIGYREPGYLWKIDLPYIWGPISGVNNVPLCLFKSLNFSGKIKLGIRSLLNTYQFKYNRQFKKALSNTDFLLTATSENQQKIKSRYFKESICLPENCIKEIYNVDHSKFQTTKYSFIFIGSVDSRKSLVIILKSLLKVKNRSKMVLHIVGDGPLKKNLEIFCIENGLSDIVVWHGKVPREEVFNLLSKSHMHLISSLSEGNPTTIWEAMSVGVPTMTIDHCGMHDVVCDKCGIRIKVQPLDSLINDFAVEIDCLLDNPGKFKDLSDGVVSCSQNYLWKQRRSYFNYIYTELIDKKNAKKKF